MHLSMVKIFFQLAVTLYVYSDRSRPLAAGGDKSHFLFRELSDRKTFLLYTAP